MINFPSYLTSYAVYQESAYPNLWNKLIRLWVPAMGNTGLRIPNLAKSVDGASIGRANATLSASDMWKTCANFQAPKGAGSSGYISATGHQFTTWTHEAWYVPVTITTQAIMTNAESPGSGTYDRALYINSSGYPVLHCYDGSTKLATATTTKAVYGVPIHILGTCNGSLSRIYVNGKYEGQVAVNNGGYTGFSSPECVMLYGRDGTSAFGSGDGYILKVAMYNRVLNPAEIKILGEDPLCLLKKPKKMLFMSDAYSSVVALRPPEPPAITYSELLLPNSDVSIGSHWSLDGGGGTAWERLDEGDTHDGYPNSVTCTNSGSLGGELKLGFELPIANQKINRFKLTGYVNSNGGAINATLYINGSVVPLAERQLAPNTSGSAGWYTLDFFSGNLISSDITSIEVGFTLTETFSSCILDSIYLQYGGSCPTFNIYGCSNACGKYIVTGGIGDFWGDVYTCIQVGETCQWLDTTSHADRTCDISCDADDGWIISFYDSNIDCLETYVSGDFGPSPPTDVSKYTCPAGGDGAGCYGHDPEDLNIASITKTNCKSGSMFFII